LIVSKSQRIGEFSVFCVKFKIYFHVTPYAAQYEPLIVANLAAIVPEAKKQTTWYLPPLLPCMNVCVTDVTAPVVTVARAPDTLAAVNSVPPPPDKSTGVGILAGI
jgi:hypothetical protein